MSYKWEKKGNVECSLWGKTLWRGVSSFYCWYLFWEGKALAKNWEWLCMEGCCINIYPPKYLLHIILHNRTWRNSKILNAIILNAEHYYTHLSVSVTLGTTLTPEAKTFTDIITLLYTYDIHKYKNYCGYIVCTLC